MAIHPRFGRLPLRSCLAITLLVTAACGASAPAGPSGVTPLVHDTVSGLVRGETPSASRAYSPAPPLSDVEITVTAGPAAGSKTRTAVDGTYSLRLPSGPFKLRFTHPSYKPFETNESTMTANGVTFGELVLETAPWSLSGHVTDRLGNAVSDVSVTIRPGDAFFSTYGTVKTDATGLYRFASESSHFNYVLVSATASGFESSSETADGNFVTCCKSNADTIYDFSLVRVIKVTPTAPTELHVGESVEIPASVVEFDNNITRNIFLLPKSNAPAVVAVGRSDNWYAMQGVSIGVAVLVFDHHGTSTALQIRVVP